MPKKTIYVRESDLALWKEAEELAQESLSGLLADALREYVMTRRAREGEMGRIVVEIAEDGDSPVVKKAFTGTWVVEDFGSDDEQVMAGTLYDVALSEKGAVVVFPHSRNDDPQAMFIFDSFEDFEGAGEFPEDLVSAVGSSTGRTYVQELDI